MTDKARPRLLFALRRRQLSTHRLQGQCVSAGGGQLQVRREGGVVLLDYADLKAGADLTAAIQVRQGFSDAT